MRIFNKITIISACLIIIASCLLSLIFPLLSVSPLYFILCFSLLIFFITVILHFYLRSILRPLEKMKSAFIDVIDGNYDAKLEKDLKGDLGDLARCFNDMTWKLKKMRGFWENGIDERREKERILNEKQKLIQGLLEYSPALIYVKNKEGVYLEVNKQYEKILNLPGKEIIGKKDFDLFSPDIAKIYIDHDQEVLGSSQPKEYQEMIPQQGEKRIYLSVRFPLFDEEDRTSLICNISIDITDQKNMENQLILTNRDLKSNERALRVMINDFKKANEKLRNTQLQLFQSERLQVVGQLASGVAHEVKNPLTVILMGVDYLSKRISTDDEETGSVIKDIITAIHKAEFVIHGLLDFSRSLELIIESLDVHKTIEDALQLVKHKLMCSHIELERKFKKDLPEIHADPNKLEQVFVNLLINAIHSIGDQKGNIIVKTLIRELTQEDPKVGRRQGDLFSVGEKVLIVEIEDSGKGIPEDIMGKIFDPFFTTKGNDGTGLGLPIIKNIVDLHKGLLLLNNKDAGGVIATVILKLNEGKAANHEKDRAD